MTIFFHLMIKTTAKYQNRCNSVPFFAISFSFFECAVNLCEVYSFFLATFLKK